MDVVAVEEELEHSEASRVEKQPVGQDQGEMMLHLVAIISTHRDDKFFDKTKGQQRPAETDRGNQWPS